MFKLKVKIGPKCETRDERIPFASHQIVAMYAKP